MPRGNISVRAKFCKQSYELPTARAHITSPQGLMSPRGHASPERAMKTATLLRLRLDYELQTLANASRRLLKLVATSKGGQTLRKRACSQQGDLRTVGQRLY